MGQYAEINGDRMKLSGAVARFASEAGLVNDEGITTISRRQVEDILSRSWTELRNGNLAKSGPWASYSTDYKISGPHLYQIAEDVNKMCILLDWLSTTEEESITFA